MRNMTLSLKWLLVFFLIIVHYVNAQQIYINEIMALNTTTIADQEGGYVDWIELYNATGSAINLQGYYLSDDAMEPLKWMFPNSTINAGQFLIVWASDKDTLFPGGEVHANFRISSNGEPIIFTHSDGTTVIDQVGANQIPTDISFGRQPDGSASWFYFDIPTPGQSNTTNVYQDILSPPSFSDDAGFYTGSILLTITGNSGDTIYYTLDGSDPTSSSLLYSVPITINQTTVIRARAFRNNYLPGIIATNTYIFNEIFGLDVISLASDPGNLWGAEGIFDNIYVDQEKSVHIEYFETNGNLGFALDGGIKLHGAKPDISQQSLRLYARQRYGTGEINYKVFDDKDIVDFKRLVLRNGGNDGMERGKTHIRDALWHILYKQNDPANGMSSYKPVNVLLNGAYWGIYNLRERQDKYYIKSNFGIEDFDFIEKAAGYPSNRNTIEGDWQQFDLLQGFADSEDLSLASNYDSIKTMMDIDNFTDYWIFEISSGNKDWLSNNIKFWRQRTNNGIWRWVLWDVEYGLGCYYGIWDHGIPCWDGLDYSNRINGGWSGTDNTILIRNLLENNEFKQNFITRFADLLNTIFKPTHVVSVIDSLQNLLSPDVQRQIDKWGSSISLWNQRVNETRIYVTQKSSNQRHHIINKFGLDSSLTTITLGVSSPGQGKININTIVIDQNTFGLTGAPYPWKGIYFKEIPIKLKALPNSGYKFINWQAAQSSYADSTVLVDKGTVWKYLDNGSDPLITWCDSSFDHSGWASGSAQLGYGDGDEATVVSYGPDPNNKYVTTYFVKTFTVNDPSQYNGLKLNLLRDDGAIIYLNGEEIVRSNLPLDKGGYSVVASCVDYQSFTISPVTFADEAKFLEFSLPGDYLIAGTNLLAVEIHQAALNSTDISFDLELIGMITTNDWEVISDIDSISITLTSDSSITAVFELIDTVQPIAEDLNPAVDDLQQNIPNPFNTTTTIGFNLNEAGYVKIIVYDIKGEHIKTLISCILQSGKHNVIWDGKNDDGIAVNSGIYFYKVETENIVKIKKAVLLK